MRTDPVSYTHLDVYKRQVYDIWHTIITSHNKLPYAYDFYGPLLRYRCV